MKASDLWCLWTTEHAGDILRRPCDSLILNVYSDAKNVLSGLIDQPENLRRNAEFFFQDRKFDSKKKARSSDDNWSFTNYTPKDAWQAVDKAIVTIKRMCVLD